MTHLPIYLFVLLLSTAYTTVGQTLEYDIVKGDNTVGYMRTQKHIQGDTIFYKVESKTKLRMLVSFEVYYILAEMYVDGVLISGESESKLNGYSQKKAQVWKAKDKYVVSLNGYQADIAIHQILYSIPMLYYSEPIARSSVFSQQFSDFLPVRRDTDSHIYTLYSEDGKNRHTYREGVCIEVKVSRPYATFYLKLRTIH